MIEALQKKRLSYKRYYKKQCQTYLYFDMPIKRLFHINISFYFIFCYDFIINLLQRVVVSSLYDGERFKQHNIFDLTNISNHDRQYTEIINITIIIRLSIIDIIRLSNIHVLNRLFMLLT